MEGDPTAPLRPESRVPDGHAPPRFIAGLEKQKARLDLAQGDDGNEQVKPSFTPPWTRGESSPRTPDASPSKAFMLRPPPSRRSEDCSSVGTTILHALEAAHWGCGERCE